jgi:hypothetical protein
MDPEAEDRLIRRWLVGGACLCVVGLVGMIVICTVLIATDFNLLNWLE